MAKGFGQINVLSDQRKTYLSFLDKVLQPKLSDAKIRKLIQGKVDAFDESFPKVLKSWANNKFSQVKLIEAEKIAGAIIVFVNLLQEVPAKDNNIKLEVVIAGYEVTADVLTRKLSPPMWAETQVNLGSAYCARNSGDRPENLELAIQCYQSALSVFSIDIFPQAWAWTKLNLGTAYFDRDCGELEEDVELAFECYQAASKVCTRESAPDQWAILQLNLGNVCCKGKRSNSLESLKQAINHYQSALEIYVRDKFPVEWATLQINLGNAYCLHAKFNEIESIEKAIVAFNSALQIYRRELYPERWMNAQNNLGNAYREIGQIEDAVEHYRSALEIGQPNVFPIDCFRIAKNWGDTTFAAQLWMESIKAYEIATRAVEYSRTWGLTEKRRREILEETIDVYAKLVEACVNANQYILALEYTEHSRSRNLAELILNRKAQSILPFPVSDRLKQLQIEITEIECQLSKGGIKGFTALERRLQKLKLQREKLQNICIPVGVNFDFNQLRSILDKNTAVISWYATGSRLFAFLIANHNPEPIVWIATPEDVQNLENWSKSYLMDYYEHSDIWYGRLSLYLSQLTSILHLNELLTMLPKECDQLILIPHRGLHLFPLHALPVTPNSCLLDHFQRGVRYSPSCNLLQLVRMHQQFRFSHLVAIQNPKGVSADGKLVYASVEVEVIAGYFSSSDVLRNEFATQASFNALDLSATHCIHFACHGYFNYVDPIQSSLQLADAQLNLDDIFGLNLPQCGLVTLSACETGQIDISTAVDEYIGLPSGFLYAGSPSVVSSLWTIDDLSTALLMLKFYDNLQTHGSVSLALNKAQLWLRNITKLELQDWLQEQEFYRKAHTIRITLKRKLSKIADEAHPFANPFHWAAFCATGQ